MQNVQCNGNGVFLVMKVMLGGMNYSCINVKISTKYRTYLKAECPRCLATLSNTRTSFPCS